MNRLKSLNVAGKLTSKFKSVKANRVLFFSIILMIILVVLALLFAGYYYLLTTSDADILWHKENVDLVSKEPRNIPASDLPSIQMGTYTLSTWFAVDKTQYHKKQDKKYSHLISYGNIRKGNEEFDNFAIGAWLDNSTNNVLVVYRTDHDDEYATYYDPNSDNFNCEHTIELKNILLNEWNLLTFVANGSTLSLYFNGGLHKTSIHDGIIHYDSNYPSMDIHIASDRNINGLQKSIRFRDTAMGSDEISDLYFKGPKKLEIPDYRDKDYISNRTMPDLYGQVGSRGAHILDKGANAIDSTLRGMDNFFRSF
jgi:hypothetical protein